MADPTVRVRIVGVDQATPAVERARRSFGGLADFLRSRFVITLGDVTRLLRSFVQGIESVITSAAEQEEAVAKLETALRSLGIESESVTQSLLDQADALAQISKFSDDEVTSAQALLATLGAQGEVLEAATRAAVNMAEALGKDLNTSALEVGKTLSGTAGRLGMIVPELANVSESALAAGEGILLLDRRFAGTAAGTRSFSEDVQNLGDAFDEMKEAIGGALIESDAVRDSIERLTSALRDNSSAAGTAAATGLNALINVAGGLLDKFGQLVQLFERVGVSFGLMEAPLETAKISSDELRASADALGVSVETLESVTGPAADAADRLAIAQRAAADAARLASAAARQQAVDVKAVADAYAAAVESAGAFGQVTSVQLEGEIATISLALEDQRRILGEQSPEWQRLRETAEAQIDLLRARVESLRSGLGDLAAATESAGQGFTDLATQTDAAAVAADTLVASNQRLAQSFDQVAVARARSTGQDFVQGPLGPGLAGGRFTTIGAPIGFVRDLVTGQLLPDGRRSL